MTIFEPKTKFYCISVFIPVFGSLCHVQNPAKMLYPGFFIWAGCQGPWWCFIFGNQKFGRLCKFSCFLLSNTKSILFSRKVHNFYPKMEHFFVKSCNIRLKNCVIGNPRKALSLGEGVAFVTGVDTASNGSWCWRHCFHTRIQLGA